MSNEDQAALQIEVQSIGAGFDHLADHVIITDPEGTIVYANSAVERHTGYRKEEIIGQKPGKVWGGKMSREFYADMWHTIKDLKRPFVGEVENVSKEGKKYWQELRISPVLDDKGQIKFFIGIEPEITSRKAAEAQKEEDYRETKEMNKIMVDREVKIAELREKVAALEKQLEEKKSPQ